MNARPIVRDLLVFVILIALSLLCFWDVLWLNFFSDDYYVMYRLTVDKVFWAPGFFRPLSDLSLLFSYFTSEYNAFGYRLFNVLLHGINGFILYKALGHIFNLKDQRNIKAAIIASIFFIVYPFHAEAMIWIVGRASLVANTFGILSIYFFFSNMPYRRRIFLSCLSYFIGLASYESIFVIPGILFLAVWHQRTIKDAFMVMIPFTITLILHLAVRLYFAGVLAGNYGKDMFGEEQNNYLVKFIKSFGRLFVPPSQGNTWLVVMFVTALAFIIGSFVFIYKYRNKYFHFYILLWLFLLVSHLIPTMFGVDTHTSDGDRLLYFPSYFLAAIVAFFGVVVFRSKAKLIGFSLAIIVISFYLIKRNNHNWIAADAAMEEVFATLKSYEGNPVFIANVPDAIEGSFVFRNGFHEALVIKNIHVNVVALNFLLNQQAIHLPDPIEPVQLPGGLWRIPPAVSVSPQAYYVDTLVGGKPFTKEVKRPGGDVFLYWNRNKVVTLLP